MAGELAIAWEDVQHRGDRERDLYGVDDRVLVVLQAEPVLVDGGARGAVGQHGGGFGPGWLEGADDHVDGEGE